MMFMQSPLLGTSVQSKTTLPSIFQLEDGLLHPRWLMLSALLDILWAIGQRIIEYIVPCSSTSPLLLSFYCEVNSWTFFWQCAIILCLFLVGWLIFFFLGYKPIMYSFAQGKKSHVKDFLRTASDIEKMRWQTFIFATIMLIIGLVMWVFKRTAAFPVVLGIITILIVIWTLCYEHFYSKGVKNKITWPAEPEPTFSTLLQCLPLVGEHEMKQRKEYKPGITIATYQKPESPEK